MFFFLQVSESDESSAAGIKCNSRKGLLSVELPHISYNNPGGGGAGRAKARTELLVLQQQQQQS